MLRTKPAKFALLICLLCIVATLSIYTVKALEKGSYHELIVIEAGDPVPAVSAYFLSPVDDAAYLTDVTAINTRSVGTVTLEIERRGKTIDVRLEIRDTQAPAAELRPLDLLPGETANITDFIVSIEDNTTVDAEFLKQPDFSAVNSQVIEIILTDEGGNQAICSTELRLSRLLASAAFEAQPGGSQPDLRALLKNPAEDSSLSWVTAPPAMNLPGSHQVEVAVDGIVFQSTIIISDTTPPTGEAVSLTGWVGQTIDPADFVTKIFDATAVTVSFATPPDFSLTGEQTIELLLTDAAGNQRRLQTGLILQQDTEGPVIYGAQKYTLYIGQTATYKKGVYAVDNRDGEVEIKVDSSAVNPRAAGEYSAVYTAVDQAGNSSSVTVAVTVKPQSVTMDELNVLADEVLAEITTEAMDNYEKAWKIYKYVNLRLTYTGTSDKTDWMSEARRGIVQGVGDCFTYYSMSNLLLNRIGMQNLSVERASKPGEARHYWHMVKVGDDWYHFDACIHKPKLESFMLTTAQIDAFSARVGKDNYYYRFARELYPETPSEPINNPDVEGMY